MLRLLCGRGIGYNSRMIKNILIASVGILLIVGGLFFWADGVYHRAVSPETDVVRVEVAEGDDVRDIARKLKERDLIGFPYFFLFGVWRDGFIGTFQAGTYDLARSLSPAEIARIIASGEFQSSDIRVTFPEGWTARQMADRLNAQGLPGEEFFERVENPSEELRARYDFLAHVTEESTLEGYLFPDTYYFLPEASGEDVVTRLLGTFDVKTRTLREEALAQGKDFADIVTMASIVEGEVQTSEDRRLVAGVFWARLDIDMPLQSDATLAYVLENRKIQHNATDLQFDSPYNTYKYKGFPPGPVGNPSLDALLASMRPTDSDYLYFLSDPATGQTYFAVDFEGHKRNKAKVGL